MNAVDIVIRGNYPMGFICFIRSVTSFYQQIMSLKLKSAGSTNMPDVNGSIPYKLWLLGENVMPIDQTSFATEPSTNRLQLATVRTCKNEGGFHFRIKI